MWAADAGDDIISGSSFEYLVSRLLPSLRDSETALRMEVYFGINDEIPLSSRRRRPSPISCRPQGLGAVEVELDTGSRIKGA